ncbi:hypothetical protein PRIC2_004972 [Phytophthora ramorum]|uniref:uncharacterized protein n=1 Tax=Phytophthora ramorum TaxID=164328 RepID=UPI0030B752FC|nr:hypothetical protein KRP23_9420 [Phytophthora ramorum]KAH7472427.1 hypothetical protein KRP23_9421 [Phytophthora ramorum]
MVMQAFTARWSLCPRSWSCRRQQHPGQRGRAHGHTDDCSVLVNVAADEYALTNMMGDAVLFLVLLSKLPMTFAASFCGTRPTDHYALLTAKSD